MGSFTRAPDAGAHWSSSQQQQAQHNQQHETAAQSINVDDQQQHDTTTAAANTIAVQPPSTGFAAVQHLADEGAGMKTARGSVKESTAADAVSTSESPHSVLQQDAPVATNAAAEFVLDSIVATAKAASPPPPPPPPPKVTAASVRARRRRASMGSFVNRVPPEDFAGARQLSSEYCASRCGVKTPDQLLQEFEQITATPYNNWY